MLNLGTSMPTAVRRGDPYTEGHSKAWTSASRGLDPSSTQPTAQPGAVRTEERNRPLGSGTGAMPLSVISKTPSSLVEPNRFFSDRRSLSPSCRSPSK